MGTGSFLGLGTLTSARFRDESKDSINGCHPDKHPLLWILYFYQIF
jgi:hypothetical protein